MPKHPNPIAFNPDTMSVSHVKECADQLRVLFDNIDQPPEDVVHSLKAARDNMLRRYGDKN
jgi:hypothetical protein